MTFARPPAGDDSEWPRASVWLAGDLRPSEADAATGPRLRVVGVPCSIGSISPSEAWRTPPAVREALARLSPYDPVSGRDLAVMDVADLGDWEVAALELVAAVDRIRTLAADLDRDDVHVFVGGDNAITRPCLAGLLGPDLGRVGLITLDAHHDVRHLDDGPRNGTPVRGLIEDGLDPRHVVQIGIGRFTNSAVHARWCSQQGIEVVTATDVHRDGIDAAVQHALDHLTAAGVEAIYLDADVDVLDVAHAPACPGARPGGFTPEQLYRAVSLLGADPRVRAMDLVEVDAAADHEGRTVVATAVTLLAFAAAVAGRPT